jgi:hypothetical protein
MCCVMRHIPSTQHRTSYTDICILFNIIASVQPDRACVGTSTNAVGYLSCIRVPLVRTVPGNLLLVDYEYYVG